MVSLISGGRWALQRAVRGERRRTAYQAAPGRLAPHCGRLRPADLADRGLWAAKRENALCQQQGARTEVPKLTG